MNGSLKLTETREYDALGRLSKIRNGNGGELVYQYDESNRLAKQTVNGIPIEYTYDKYGRLVRKALMGIQRSSDGLGTEILLRTGRHDRRPRSQRSTAGI